jgi:hypothetical protein
MKKFLIFLFSGVILLLVLIYALIPSQLEVSKVDYAKCNISAAFRVVSDTSSWQKWWPTKEGLIRKTKSGEDDFFYRGFSFVMNEKFYNSLQVNIRSDMSDYNSRMNFIKLNIDSIAVFWKCEIPTSINPVTRFLKYREAESLKKSMTNLLANLRKFLENQKNIYGIDLYVTMSKDSTMVLTTSISKKYPTTSDVYQLVENLKKYIAAKAAKETNFPMLHVKKLPDSTFETMVAIPVNKRLTGNGTISFSRFIPWKVLTAEVKGGNATVDEALIQMRTFINDYQKIAMAIPFESLVTDRSKEPDTSKWITRIYTPIP